MSLPLWKGAESVYARLMSVAEAIQQREYSAQRTADKRKNFKFSPNQDGVAISVALGIGDEETCKGLLAKHFYVQGAWISP